jgi:hypothetical protein
MNAEQLVESVRKHAKTVLLPSVAQAIVEELAAQEELRLCKQDAIKLQDECIADTPPKQSTELPEASPETKGVCNTERACAACYSGQGDCEVTV